MKKIFTILMSAFGMIATTHAQTALQFNGTNQQHVEVNNNSIFDITSDITVEGWVYVDAYPADWTRLIGKGDATNRTYCLWIRSSGSIRWQMYGSDILNLETAPGIISTGTWYHIAATRNGNLCTIYLNGVEIISTTYNATPFSSTEPFTIGGETLIHQTLNGQMDNVRIWNVARTEAQINASMNKCLLGSEIGLVASYDFEDGTGSSILTDLSPNGNNGTLMNMNPTTDWVSNSAGPQAPSNQQITASPSAIVCNGQSTINVAATEVGTEYYLRNNADGVIVDGPITGTGSDINFDTGLINDTTEFNVYAANFGGVGNGLAFNGINKRIVVQNDASLMAPNGTLTAEMWAKSNTASWNNQGMLMSLRDVFIIHPTGSNIIQFMIYIDGTLHTIQDVVSDITVWHQYALSYDGTTFKGFVDGELVAQTNITGTVNTSSQPLYIGFDNATGGRYFNGQVDDARVWSVARSDAQISSYYDKCLNGDENGLEMYLPMEQNSGTVVQDITGNGNNGDAQNINDPADWVDGAIACPVCDIQMSPTVTVIVDTIDDQTISTTTPSICPSGGSVTIDVASSQETVLYFLMDDSNDSLVGGPVEGTGGAIAINSGNITTNTTFNVQAVKPDNGLEFDGNNDIVVIGNTLSSDIEGTNTITVEAWVNPSTSTGFGVIIGNYSYPTNNNNLQFLLRRTSNYYEFFINDGNGYQAVNSTTGSVQVGEWQHVVGTWDGSTSRIYVNGVELGVNSSLTGAGFPALANEVVIGGNAINEYFEGTIDDVRIWNTTRTNAEISNNILTCLNGNETGLLAYYRLNELSGATTAMDATGNGYNGTLSNMDETTAWTSGLVGCNCSEVMSSTVSVVLEDTEDPVLVDMPVDITINANTTNCEGVATWTAPTATDNCTASPTITYSHNSGDAFPLGTTTVTITATDDENNSASATFDVTVINDLDATTSVTNVLCNGDEDGEIELTVNGGSGTFTYSWNDAASSTTQNLEEIGAGAYSVTITDENGCETTASATVTEPDELIASTTVTDLLCNGDEDGEIELTVNGGTGAYSFSWDDAASSTTQNLENLGAGTYNVDITDENNCEVSTSATVTEPDAISASATSTQETMGGDGSIDLTVSGGTGAYTYDWTGPNNYTSTDQNPDDLVGGTYEVTITDENGCTFTLEVVVESVVGLSENKLNDFKLFPNPSIGTFTISSSVAGTIDIINSNGQVIHAATTQIGETEYQLTQLARGVYSVRLTTEYGIQLKKLVIQ